MYSQGKEEIVILDYFKGFTGHLLSLGENDGKTFSNALALIEKGWTADLVEPSTEAFRRLKNLHEGNNRVVLHNVAVGEKCGFEEFYESGSHLNCNDHSLLSTLKESETQRWNEGVDFVKTKVMVVDFKTLLSECAFRQFDFISIDIEGMDLEVLRQMDIKGLGCKMICIEYNGKNQKEFDKLIPMPVIHKNNENLIYAKR